MAPTAQKKPAKSTNRLMKRAQGFVDEVVLPITQNLLAPPGDGDIIVPQRALSIVGTSSWTVEPSATSKPIPPC